MSYERRLIFNLRLRGLSEAEIAGVIEGVRSHEADVGTTAETELGAAEDYARQFPKNKRRTRGTIITTIGAILAIAYVLLAVLLATLFSVDIREYVGPITLLPGLLVILAGTLAGFLTDYFQPSRSSRAC